MSTQIVLPCFNEEQRLDIDEVCSLLVDPDIGLIFVDDGSTDGTVKLLDNIKSTNVDRVEILVMANNRGKAEAVRQGMKLAISKGARVTGYMDADFATPASEMLRLVNIMQRSYSKNVVIAARWAHLGAKISRSPFRHYAGRIFATFASMILELTIYDTQCGAKLFRVNEGLNAALETVFLSRWAFDVELIGRLKQRFAEDQFLEVPLNTWVDKSGSKIGLYAMLKATLELVLIWRSLKKF
ncbi:MAG: glycosyltransferase [Pseudomonadales bacterium]|nr:glycosyltransferase [Pseudomonadales bacterium]